MAIEISLGEETPQLLYNRILLCDLHMVQRLKEIDAEPPHYTLNIEVRKYAVDGDGRRHYATKTDTITIDDYATVAYVKAMAGDPDLANAATAIEAALAKILVDQRPEYGLALVV